MSPITHSSRQACQQTFGFAVTGANRGRTYVWVEATSVEAGRARLAPLFPGCSLAHLMPDEVWAPPSS